MAAHVYAFHSQHFLTDRAVVKQLMQQISFSADDRIIEIGAGSGSITRALAQTRAAVTAFEKDVRFKNDLAVLQQTYPHLKVIFDDALKHSWEGSTKLIANPPFHLVESILLKAMRDSVAELFLIVGEHFRNLLQLQQHTFALLAHTYYAMSPRFFIKKTSFTPQPRTHAFLLHFKKRGSISTRDALLLSFALRKGKIKNSLRAALMQQGVHKREAKAFIDALHLSSQVLNKPTSKLTGRLLLRIDDELKKLKQLT